MATPFADPTLWNHATFTFAVQFGAVTIDERGNRTTPGKQIAITFKMKKSGGNNLQQKEEASELSEVYGCKVGAVDGDYESFRLPQGIKPGDVGDGTLNGRSCRATIKSIAQSSIVLIPQILGDGCTLEVDYRIRRGSAA